ncbi:maleylpyruvate isomerase family mycothiol-dependent enzyme [Nocardia suismassiliense]|uniref:maleylpyruvate isomerase family mycothiol-dependent enzyme n=1 Tax=Nocardia suismassiliense TaxID=2077092 RepID=UPI0018FE4688|nr:maleylpyruvate isomerase family mycothiol-dependent enzyme [Nocardia suismassiliense]
MTSAAPATDLAWLRAGTSVLLDAVDDMPDDQLRQRCSLPQWTRRHLVAHLIGNAQALSRLASWAATGVATPMYPDARARNDEIEERARYSADRLRHDLHDSAAALEQRLARLGPAQWQRQVRTAQGRTVAATEIPWLRIREVWIHAADLDTGITFSDIPIPLLERLVEDVMAQRSRRGIDPPFAVELPDGQRWSLGDHPVATVTGPAAVVAAWLTGRGAAPHPEAPILSRWL